MRSAAAGPIFTRLSPVQGPRSATVGWSNRALTSIGTYDSPEPHSWACETSRTTGAKRFASACSSARRRARELRHDERGSGREREREAPHRADRLSQTVTLTTAEATTSLLMR